MHVDRAGAAVVGIVAPDLREQLRAREDAARVHGHEFEELKLLEGQIERGPGEMRRIGLRVDNQVAGPDDAFLRRIVLGLGLTHDGQAQAGIHFGGGSLIRNDVVHLPGGGNRRHTALVKKRDEGEL